MRSFHDRFWLLGLGMRNPSCSSCSAPTFRRKGRAPQYRPGMMGKRDFFRMRLTYSRARRRFKVPLNKLQNPSGGGKFLIRRPSDILFVPLQLPALLISETQAGWTRDGGGALLSCQTVAKLKVRGQASAFWVIGLPLGQ